MHPHHPHHGHRYDQVEHLRDPGRVSRLEVTRVVDLALESLSAYSVLDIGIGSGLFSQAFQQRGLHVTGIDANPHMLQAARKFLPSAMLAQAVAEEVPFANRQFDLVFMGLVLHEADDLPTALREARRIAIQRLAVLEWPYRETDFGPGLEERISPEMMISLGERAQPGKITSIPLQNLVLYRMDSSD